MSPDVLAAHLAVVKASGLDVRRIVVDGLTLELGPPAVDIGPSAPSPEGERMQQLSELLGSLAIPRKP